MMRITLSKIRIRSRANVRLPGGKLTEHEMMEGYPILIPKCPQSLDHSEAANTFVQTLMTPLILLRSNSKKQLTIKKPRFRGSLPEAGSLKRDRSGSGFFLFPDGRFPGFLFGCYLGIRGHMHFVVVGGVGSPEGIGPFHFGDFEGHVPGSIQFVGDRLEVFQFAGYLNDFEVFHLFSFADEDFLKSFHDVF